MSEEICSYSLSERRMDSCILISVDLADANLNKHIINMNKISIN